MLTWESLVNRQGRCEPPPERFVKNRARLDALITSLSSFSTKEIEDKFAAGGDIVFDSEENATDHLKFLVSIGVLRYEFGRYSHPASLPATK